MERYPQKQPAAPNVPFTPEDYWSFMHKYEQAHESALNLDLLSSLRQEYRARLPQQLLARCPFCNAFVWEPIDIYSVKGAGWRYRCWSGYGWFGALDSRPGFVQPSYQTDCPHIVIANCCLERGHWGTSDNDCNEFLARKPYVMLHPMQQPATVVVVHALEIGTAESHPSKRRMVYFNSYFVPDETTRQAQYALWETTEMHQYVCYPLEFQLDALITAKRLYWLRTQETNQPLATGDPTAFPYKQARKRWWDW